MLGDFLLQQIPVEAAHNELLLQQLDLLHKDLQLIDLQVVDMLKEEPGVGHRGTVQELGQGREAVAADALVLLVGQHAQICEFVHDFCSSSFLRTAVEHS